MVLLSSSVMVQANPVEVQDPTSAVELEAVARAWTLYEVTLDASVAGACHCTSIDPSPGVAVTDRGAVGLPPGVEATRSEDAPSPALFVA